ncbi:MAG: hypothetical protein IJF39_01165 [Clostridia bacterium]|nr:hypothetical protein [Clostridia bacterium]
MKKKTLISFLASLGCLACLAGCGADTSGLEAAKDYIKELYKNEATETGADFERAGKITIKGVEYTIEWSVNTNEISVTKDTDGDYVIDIDEAAEADVDYVLTAVITDPKGNKETLTYNYKMPKFRELTHAEFVATEVNKAVVVKGVITGVVNTDSKHEVYFEDADGGYYIYNLDAETTATLQIGQEIRVRGTRGDYYGTHQITGASVEILNQTATAVVPNDITTIFAAAADVNVPELTSLQSSLVTIKGVTILGQVSGDSTYYDFMLGENRSYVRLSSSACMLSTDDQKTFKDTVKANVGKSADVTGIVTLYNGRMYLSPVTADAYSNFQDVERTDAEKVALEEILMTGLKSKISYNVDLQTAGKVATDVAITWVSNNETVAKVEGGKLVITRPDKDAEDVNVTLTATITAGTETKNVVFNIVVPKQPSHLPQAVAETPVVGTEYKMYLNQENLETTLFLAGGIDNGYLVTTDDYNDAATVTVEDAGNGKFYLNIDGAYLALTVKTNSEGAFSGYNISLERNVADASALTWSDTYKTLVYEDENGGGYIGSYNKYETVSASKLSYISTSFPARLCTMVPAEEWVDTLVPQYQEMTITEALAAADGTNVEVSGTVSKVDGAWNEQFGNMNVTIKDADGNELYVYRLGTKVVLGDIITVKGSLTTYNDKKQIGQGGTAEITGHDESYDNPPEPTYAQMSITEALAAADGTNVEVSGTVSIVNGEWSTQYKNMNVTITDAEGNTLYVYRLATQVALGDIITVKGAMATYEGARQIAQGATAVITGHDDSYDESAGGDTPAPTTPEEIVNAAYALAKDTALTGTYTLTGVITSIDSAYNSQYGNVSVVIVVGDMTDKPILCYRMKGEGADTIGVADEITVTGTLKNYGGKVEFDSGCTFVLVSTHVCEAWDEATCQVPETCPVCGDAKVGSTTVDCVYVEGVCKWCNAPEGVQTITASKTIAELITANGWTTSTTKQSFTLDDVVSVKVDGGSNTGKAYNNDHIRIYATDSPAGSLTISLAEGYELVSVKITAQTGTYAYLYVDGTTTDICNQTVAVSGSSVVLTSAKNGSDGKQVRITAIEVVYKAATPAA